MFHKFVKISLNITVVKEQIKSVHSLQHYCENKCSEVMPVFANVANLTR